MHAIVHAADVQDRDGGALLMARPATPFPFLIKLYADGGYQGPELPRRDEHGFAARQPRDRQAVASSHRASSRCPSAGSSNAQIGWVAADDWPRTGQRLNHKRLAFLCLDSIRLMLRHAAKTMQSGIMRPAGSRSHCVTTIPGTVVLVALFGSMGNA